MSKQPKKNHIIKIETDYVDGVGYVIKNIVAPDSFAAVESVQDTPPEGYIENPYYCETRTKRVQLVAKPTLIAQAKLKAAKQNRSLNDYINALIAEDLAKP